MKYRIARWASAGFLVAGFWALFAFVTFPICKRTNEGCLDSRQYNLPRWDSWQALLHQSL